MITMKRLKLDLNANAPIFHADTDMSSESRDILPSFSTKKGIKLKSSVGQLPHGNNPGYSLQILSYCLIIFMELCSIAAKPPCSGSRMGWVPSLSNPNFGKGIRPYTSQCASIPCSACCAPS